MNKNNYTCELINEFFMYLQETESKNEKTIQMYHINMNEFCSYLFGGVEFGIDDIKTITTKDITDKWLNLKRGDGLKAASINQRLATVTKFYTYLIGMGLIDINIPKQISKYKDAKGEEYVPVFLEVEEAKQLLESARVLVDKEETEYMGQRNLIIIKLFLGAGLRINELATLKISAFDFKHSTVTVTGKRNKTREVAIHPGLALEVQAYINIRNTVVCEDDDAMFATKRWTVISTDQVRYVVRKIARHASVNIEDRDIDKLRPHSLRHSYATIMLSSGASIKQVQDALGHTSPDTTERYLHLMKTDKKQMALLNPFFN